MMMNGGELIDVSRRFYVETGDVMTSLCQIPACHLTGRSRGQRGYRMRHGRELWTLAINK